MAPAQPGPQSYYLTSPVYDTSVELDRVFASVRQIRFTAEYETYVFDERSGVTESDVLAGQFKSRADTVFAETLTKSGTAVIIAHSGIRLTLLTVNHVVRFPPVRFEYYEEEPGRTGARDTPRRVASASVRTAERGLLLPHPGPRPFEVLARDERNDLALLGLDLGEFSDESRFAALRLDAGDARRLSWGSFVYVIGFPQGYPMVTRAIVSNPDWDGRGSFVTDGIWNEGMSGGLIMAVRAETGNLELVGLARASAAERELRLRPDTTGIGPGVSALRYEGPLYVETGLRIQYGITLPVSMNFVRDFLDREKVSLRGRD